MESKLEIINNAELVEAVTAHSGCQVFGEALQRIANDEDLLRVLGRYVCFNSVFGSGVANLAAHIRLRQDLFNDPNEPELACVKIAGWIFFAAIAEFGDRTHADHRTLALTTLKGAASFFGYSHGKLNSLVSMDEATKSAKHRVLDGYGSEQSLNDQKVFMSIGFHMSSEMLADEEFNLLDGFLRTRYPNLVHYLKNAKVEIGGVNNRGYDWVRIHTSVEADHLRAALAGANLALRYYAGPQHTAEVKGWILDGFNEFAVVQKDFMKSLLDPR